MDLHMHSHRFAHRLPDWTAAAVSGFAAGAIMMVVELLWSTLVTDTGPWGTTHMIAAMVMGPVVLQSSGFSFGVVLAALIVHYLLGVVFGMILAAIIAPYHFDSSIGMVMLTGAVFGLAMYLFNFYGMVRVYTWFAELRGWATADTHLIFGIAAAVLYRQFERV